MQAQRLQSKSGWRCLGWLALLSCALTGLQTSAWAGSQADALLARHASMQAQLAASPLGRELVVDSAELPDGLRGEVFAVIDHDFAQVRQALTRPANWCEMLLLHINNRRCTLGKGEGGARTLSLSVVRRYDLAVESAFVLPLVLRVDDSSAADYLLVELRSDAGPLGTNAHLVRVEAVPLPEANGKTFLHFSYSYEHSALVHMATQAYLATFGRHKVGFTVVGQSDQGKPDYIRGLRGLVERNSVRYFLTVEAYLDAMSAPLAQQVERRMQNWYAGAERYPRQLHEINLETYLAIKRSDRARAAPSP